MGGMSKKNKLMAGLALGALAVGTGGFGLLAAPAVAGGAGAAGALGGAAATDAAALAALAGDAYLPGALGSSGEGTVGIGSKLGGGIKSALGGMDKLGKGMGAANTLGLLQPEQQPQASPNPPGLGGPPPMSSVQLMQGPDAQIEAQMEMERRKRTFAGLGSLLGA